MKDLRKETKLVPKLRFREFEGEWASTTLGKTSKFSKGKNISKGDITKNGSTECIRYGELYTDYKELIEEIVSRTNLDTPDLVLSEVYDILIPASGETAIDISTASCLLKDNVALGGDINIIKTSEYGPFLTYYLKHKKKYDIARVAQGNSVVHLYPHLLKNLKVHFPSNTEQQKIASFLTAVDKRIEQLTKKEMLLEEYKKGVMQKIFNQEIRFKDENGNDFPEWEEKKLGDYLIQHHEITERNNQYPVLTSSHRGIFLQKDYFAGKDVASADTTGYNVVPYGYFTYRHMSDTLVFKFNINNIVERGIVSTLYPVFTTKNINSEFLLIKLNEGYEFKKYAILQKQGGSRTYMYYKKLEKLQISLPTIKEQERIITFTKELSNKIDQAQNLYSSTLLYKKGLLQQMFI